MKVIKSGHSHQLGWGQHGEIVECSCGARFKFREYPNAAYSGWVRTWPSVFGIHPRPRDNPEDTHA